MPHAALNLLTDVEGLSVGHATDLVLGSGVTVIVFDEPATASGTVLGGGVSLKIRRPLASRHCHWAQAVAAPARQPKNSRAGARRRAARNKKGAWAVIIQRV